MSVVLHAYHALRLNFQLTLGYLVAAAVLVGPLYFGDYLVAQSYPKDALPSWLPLYATLQDVYLVLGASLIQTLFFASLGRTMDRPLWRCFTHREALERFYSLWLLVNLFTVLLIRIQVQAARAGIPELEAFMELLVLAAMVLLPMFAACVMYHGKFAWSQLADALAPFLRFPMLVLPVMLLHLGTYFIHIMLVYGLASADNASPLFQTLAILPTAFLELLCFAAMWRVCMYHRDHGQNLESDPYDF